MLFVLSRSEVGIRSKRSVLVLVIVTVNDLESLSQVSEIGLCYVVLNEYSKLSLEYF